jgi:hypothetical protein
MATTTNYGWTTPNDTDLVKDGAAAIRTLGSSIDTTTKALNPSTTLGDIEYRSATANTNTRLPIGTNGQALVVSGGVPAWGSPASAPSFSLLNAGGTALSGTTTTISGISGMSTLWINITELSTTAASAAPYIRFNTDSGNNYNDSGSWNNAGASYSTGVIDQITTGTGGGTFTYFGQMSGSASSIISGGLMVYGCNSSGTKVGMLVSSASASGGNGHKGVNKVFNYVGTSAITSVSILSGGAQTFDSGTIYVYGSA